MANQEACELYIEQQIQEGLDEGQTPYYIGHHLSKWIEKLFGAKINPETIKSRAYRKQQEVGSNEPKKSKAPDNKAFTEEFHPKKFDSGRGGQREGAGRKPKLSEIENEKTKDIFKNDHIQNQLTQKTIWLNVENILANLTKYMKENCETPADISDHAKKKIKRHIGLLKIYHDQL